MLGAPHEARRGELASQTNQRQQQQTTIKCISKRRTGSNYLVINNIFHSMLAAAEGEQATSGKKDKKIKIELHIMGLCAVNVCLALVRCLFRFGLDWARIVPLHGSQDKTIEMNRNRLDVVRATEKKLCLHTAHSTTNDNHARMYERQLQRQRARQHHAQQ